MPIFLSDAEILLFSFSNASLFCSVFTAALEGVAMVIHISMATQHITRHYDVNMDLELEGWAHWTCQGTGFELGFVFTQMAILTRLRLKGKKWWSGIVKKNNQPSWRKESQERAERKNLRRQKMMWPSPMLQVIFPSPSRSSRSQKFLCCSSPPFAPVISSFHFIISLAPTLIRSIIHFLNLSLPFIMQTHVSPFHPKKKRCPWLPCLLLQLISKLVEHPGQLLPWAPFPISS